MDLTKSQGTVYVWWLKIVVSPYHSIKTPWVFLRTGRTHQRDGEVQLMNHELNTALLLNVTESYVKDVTPTF